MQGNDPTQILNEPLFTIGGSPVTPTTLLTGVIVVVLTYCFSWLLQAAIRRGLRKRGVDEHGGTGVALRLLHYIFIISGIAIALQTAGIKLGALFAAGAVFAVGLGFAMQNIAQNFVSGVILLVERTIKPGDVIEIDSTIVKVREMGIRATIVRTREDEDLIVPNSKLVTSTVKNLTLGDKLYRLRVVVGVTYSSDMKLVKSTLEQAAQDLEWRAQEQEPQVLLDLFNNSSVDWEVSVWIEDPWDYKPAKSRLREAIWWAFHEKGIVIAFPQVDVHFDAAVETALDQLGKAA